MKLQKFTAPTTQKAIAKIHEALGTEALIYSTRNFEGGVEIVAACPHAEEVDTFEFEDFGATASPENRLVEKLNAELTAMSEKVSRLSNQMNQQASPAYATDGLLMKKNVLQHHLTRLGFSGKFSETFIHDYIESRSLFDTLNEADIHRTLLNYIKTDENEFIDSKNICALIGPTGIGKTTTIAKLAKRYISRYGSAAVGFITTDYCDIASKNQLSYYSNLLNVDMEYANSAKELEGALHAMRDKNLVLIDTYGVSQRDQINLNELLSFIGSQGNKINTYLTLPCNIQEGILEEITRAFKTMQLRGAILTKQDESSNISAAMSVCMNHKIPVSYICHGQNIHTDITRADSDMILKQILQDGGVAMSSVVHAVEPGMHLSAGTINEGRYERQFI